MNRLPILIVDDEELNRDILAACFEGEYEVLQAADGLETLRYLEERPEIRAILLDIYLPNMDGITVLQKIREKGLSKKYPIFMITAANDVNLLSKAYEYGADDIIPKPFNRQFMKCRVDTVIELYSIRDDLQGVVNEQVKKLEAVNRSMIQTLATLIEFRDGESGEHVKRICSLTERLLVRIGEMYPEYQLTPEQLRFAVDASVLHDVGKIAIPDSILKKPGRLTQEEYAIMKEHTTRGAEMLSQIPNLMDDELYAFCYDICRHHHERWDGNGYPDGLKGDEITIWAQAVSIADVYDALTSPRCYKAAFSRDKAVHMIYNGECGVFNPKLLEAFHSLEQASSSPQAEEQR